MNVPPCKDCKNRHMLCHATCEKYKFYRAKLDTVNKERASYVATVSFMMEEKRALRAYRGTAVRAV